MTTPAAATPQPTPATAPPPPPAAGAAPGAGGAGTSSTPPAPAPSGTPPAGTFLTPTPTPTDTGKTQDGATGAGKDGQPGVEAKAGEPPAEDFEIKLPEGAQADQQVLDGYKALAKESGLKGEQAQKIADFFVKAQVSQLEQQQAQREQTLKQWSDAISNDQEFGGAKLKESQVLAQKAYAKFASPELQKFLNATGLSSHPEVARLFYRLGKADGEDVRVAPGNPSESTGQLNTAALYPNTKFPGQR